MQHLSRAVPTTQFATDIRWQLWGPRRQLLWLFCAVSTVQGAHAAAQAAEVHGGGMAAGAPGQPH